MKKKLVTPANLTEFLGEDDKVFHVGREFILSSGAKDMLRNKGVTIQYGKPAATVETAGNSVLKEPETTKPTQERPVTDDVALLGNRVVTLLTRKYGLTDAEQIQKVSVAVLQRLTEKK